MDNNNNIIGLLGACIILCCTSSVAGEFAISPAAVDRVIVQYANSNTTTETKGLKGLEIVTLNEEDTVDQALSRLEVRTRKQSYICRSN
jgi:hypothetical protein